MTTKINSVIKSHLEVTEKMIETLQNHIYTGCILVEETIKRGNKIVVFGSSSNDLLAQYIVTVFNDTMDSNLYGISLNNNIDKNQNITFERQVRLLANSNDLLIGLSTSGNDKNVLRALSTGKNIGCKIIGFSGYDGGAMSEFCDINLVIPSDNETQIREMYVVVGHIFAKTLVPLKN